MRLTRRNFLNIAAASAAHLYSPSGFARNQSPWLCAEGSAYRLHDHPWIRCGCNSPENLLSFSGIANTPDGVHDFEPHRDDFRPIPGLNIPDRLVPIIGALQYLSRYVNSLYVLLYTIDGGDDGHIHPWLDPETKTQIDHDKLDDWYLIFSAANALGIELQLFFSEKENQWNVLRNWSYYRALLLRFRDLPLITWNIGEENDYAAEEQRELATLIHRIDNFHPIAVHTNHNQPQPQIPGQLDSLSLQCNINRFDTWAEELAPLGLALFADEQLEGYAGPHAINTLTRGWRRFMERGGAGFGCYLGNSESGSSIPNANDLYVNDFRTIEPLLIAMSDLHAEVAPPTASEIRSHQLYFHSHPRRLDINRDNRVDIADGLRGG